MECVCPLAERLSLHLGWWLSTAFGAVVGRLRHGNALGAPSPVCARLTIVDSQTRDCIGNCGWVKVDRSLTVSNVHTLPLGTATVMLGTERDITEGQQCRTKAILASETMLKHNLTQWNTGTWRRLTTDRPQLMQMSFADTVRPPHLQDLDAISLTQTVAELCAELLPEVCAEMCAEIVPNCFFV